MSLCNMLCLLHVCKHNLACSLGVFLRRANVISLVSWFKLGRFLYQNFFHVTNTWRSKNYIRLFPKTIGNTDSRFFPEISEEIASFYSNSKMRDISNFERHLGASSKGESKLTTSPFTEFVIICIFPQEQFNVQTTLLAYDWQLELNRTHQELCCWANGDSRNNNDLG